ncbi:unnamed protein product [Brassica rapa]|nr:unnamed protein product [Brassica rapa]
MSIDPKLLLSNFPVVIGTLGLLILGKTILVVVMGKLFGISVISAIRAGLLLAPGGEFAFVAFGEAVNQGIMSPQLSSLLFLVVGISMAITPWLAAGGQLIASRFELHDVRSLLPVESETDDLQDHIIICGFGRVGQIIAQLLSERLIPFVALDVKLPTSEIANTINEFRNRHLSELTELCEASRSSLGYGFSRTTTTKPKTQTSDATEENQIIEGSGSLAI